MPGPKKFKSFGKLGEYLKKLELESAGKKFVDSGANTAKGTRSRIGTGVIKTTPAKTQKVTVLQETPVELPTFKPYYINGENPNILTSEQQEWKDALVKGAQIDLTKYQRELANRGVNTPAFIRRATASAVATDPNAIMSPQEGMYRLPYRSATQIYEGAPLREWFDLASEGMLPYGPNALWRKWEQPLKDATNSFNVIGQLRGIGAPAPEMSLQQLGEALRQMTPYLKKEGGVLSAKSGIHIKKKNRGKFTSWCGGKVTSECIARGKRSSNPAIRKRATFAANSRKWAKKHDSGGKFLNWWRRES